MFLANLPKRTTSAYQSHQMAHYQPTLGSDESRIAKTAETKPNPVPKDHHSEDNPSDTGKVPVKTPSPAPSKTYRHPATPARLLSGTQPERKPSGDPNVRAFFAMQGSGHVYDGYHGETFPGRPPGTGQL